MIDLHLHTTASDGLLSPEALVRAVAAAGIRTMAVTDHDTVASVSAALSAGRTAGIDVIPGIEITAVDGGRDIHVLGYFLDGENEELGRFLVGQRADRRRRVAEMLVLLDKIGAPIDPADVAIETGAQSERAVGRPLVAAALVRAGHATDVTDAFERYLGDGRPAFVERVGAAPREVVAIIARAGGIASLAHPAKIVRQELVVELARDGLPAIEVFHPDHDEAAVERYRALANQFDLAMTGGSDYHGPLSVREWAFGKIALPAEEFERLRARSIAYG